MALNRYKLSQLIIQRREKYNGIEELPIRGVSRDGFISPKQENADLSIYNVFYQNDFVFNPARMELNSIALNTEIKKGICSSLYEIFYVSRNDILLPEYLNLFIKRNEFARRCSFDAIGSARNYFRTYNLGEFEIDLPPLEVQKKYVKIYKALQYNLKVYESKLDDLKLVCDGYIENLKKNCECKKIGKYISRVDIKNSDNKIKNVKNVSVYKCFNEPTSKVNRNELKNYKVVKPNQISFVQTTHNEKVFAYALNDTDDDIVVSSVNEVFESDLEYLLPEYLCMFFNRKEFDRYARFHSWGSARETFTWNDLINVKIPIPTIDVQKNISNVFKIYNKRKKYVEVLKNRISNICPILIAGAMKEAR